MDLITLTTRAHRAAGVTIAGIRTDDWDRPTPCAEWTVRDIVKHLIEGHDSRTAEATGHPMKSRPSADDDLARSYEESSADFLAAFDAEALEKTFDFGTFGPLPGKNAMAVLFVDTLTHH